MNFCEMFSCFFLDSYFISFNRFSKQIKTCIISFNILLSVMKAWIMFPVQYVEFVWPPVVTISIFHLLSEKRSGKQY